MMTDAEIIKALEQEIHLAEYVDSDYCTNTAVSLIKAALDLINCQKAEIERLKDESIGTCELAMSMRNSENFDLDCDYCIKKIKAEAINKFVERLIELYTDEHIANDMHCSIGVIKQNIYDVKEIMESEIE